MELFPYSGELEGRGETSTQVGPLERANLNPWTTGG
jgi:hypothetical protein